MPIVCEPKYTHKHTHTFMHAHTRLCTNICTQLLIHLHIYAHMHTNMHACPHTHTHTHMHTQSESYVVFMEETKPILYAVYTIVVNIHFGLAFLWTYINKHQDLMEADIPYNKPILQHNLNINIWAVHKYLL